jgi:hypothetical protein
LFETKDHLYIALDENYITIQMLNNYLAAYENCLKLLNGYIAYLKKAKKDN